MVPNQDHPTTHDAERPEYWQKRWTEGRTGWDLGGTHPLFAELLAEAIRAGLKPSAKVLEPGCGRAHTAAALAREGFNVTAFDVSPEAIAAAKLLYDDAGSFLTLTVADAFNPPAAWKGAFDAVYDRAVLCALPSPARRAYIRTCESVLRPGGLFLSIPFSKLYLSEAEGPPFAITQDGLESLLSPKFEKVYLRDVPNKEKDTKIASEMVTVWRRKS